MSSCHTILLQDMKKTNNNNKKDMVETGTSFKKDNKSMFRYLPELKNT